MQDCNRTCLLEDAPCNRYKVCSSAFEKLAASLRGAAKHLEPQPHAAAWSYQWVLPLKTQLRSTKGFSYFCDDGSAPDPSGCCQILFTRHAQCPMLPLGSTSCARSKIIPESSMAWRKWIKNCQKMSIKDIFRFDVKLPEVETVAGGANMAGSRSDGRLKAGRGTANVAVVPVP